MASSSAEEELAALRDQLERVTAEKDAACRALETLDAREQATREPIRDLLEFALFFPGERRMTPACPRCPIPTFFKSLGCKFKL